MQKGLRSNLPLHKKRRKRSGPLRSGGGWWVTSEAEEIQELGEQQALTLDVGFVTLLAPVALVLVHKCPSSPHGGREGQGSART